MNNYQIPKPNQVRCQICGKPVDKSRLRPVKLEGMARISSEDTPIKMVKLICMACLETLTGKPRPFSVGYIVKKP